MGDEALWATVAKAVLLGILPVLLLVIGLLKLLATRRFIAHAYRTRGRVIGKESELPGDTGSSSDRGRRYGRPAWRPEFEYTGPDGQRRTARTPRATVAYNFEIGTEHEILVDADVPDIADIPGGALYFPGGFLRVLGFMLGLGGLYAFGVV